MEVKNLKGYTKISCSCGSYICHWENYSGKKATSCSKLGCSETKGLVGAHVLKCHENSSNLQYLVPLCGEHNHYSFDECFKLKGDSILVPVVNRSKCKLC